METTERIVEAYVRYVKGWATIPNVRCAGQNEIDLVAIDPVSLARYHIEVSISISSGFRKLTAKPFDPEKVKQRVHQASQRRTVGFFVERKFNTASVVERLSEMGFTPGNYTRVIVTWGWDDDAAEQAAVAGIELWDFRDLIREVAAVISGSSEYFADDTLRILNLFIHASDEAIRKAGRQATNTPKLPRAKQPRSRHPSEEFWVYENWPNKAATVHRGSCSFCNEGRGLFGRSSTASGRWLGPFDTLDEAMMRAEQTGRKTVRRCGACTPTASD